MSNMAIGSPAQPAATNSQFFSTSLSLMPKIREFQKGPEGREVGEIEFIARKVIGELCFGGLIVIMIIEAVVRGVFVVIGEMLNSLSGLLDSHEVKPKPAPESAFKHASIPEQTNNNDATTGQTNCMADEVDAAPLKA